MDNTVHDSPRSWPSEASLPWAARHEHIALWSELTRHEAALVDAVAAGSDHEPPRRALVDFLRDHAAVHLRNEELILHRASCDVGEDALAASLEPDRRALLRLARHIDEADTGLEAALSARAVVTVFFLRMEKEETVLLPALKRAGVELADLAAGRELVPDPYSA